MKNDCIRFFSSVFRFYFELHPQTGITLVELNYEPELVHQHDAVSSILATIISGISIAC